MKHTSINRFAGPTDFVQLMTLVMLVLGACDKQRAAISDSPSFLTTLDIHLNAIETSNLDKLGPTVANSVSMIGPNGKRFETKEVFMDFHKNWFAKDNWAWQGKILKTESSDSLGYALIQYQFVQKDTSGNILFRDNEYLLLIFRNFHDAWQLVHDQNTAIQELNKK